MAKNFNSSLDGFIKSTIYIGGTAGNGLKYSSGFLEAVNSGGSTNINLKALRAQSSPAHA